MMEFRFPDLQTEWKLQTEYMNLNLKEVPDFLYLQTKVECGGSFTPLKK